MIKDPALFRKFEDSFLKNETISFDKVMRLFIGLRTLLEESSIPYMIIGGQAVLLYGEPRLTRDIDITLGVNTDKLYDILRITKKVLLKVLPEDIYDFVKTTMVIPTFHDTGIRVDFIFSFSPYEKMQFPGQERYLYMEKGIFTSPEDLVIHKIFAGRPRDLEDVRTVLLKNPDIDRNYIERWLREFDSQ